MSYFLITSKNTLPEQFQSAIPVTDKQAIAEKLIVESFLTLENYSAAKNSYSSIPIISSFRYVDGYTVTSVTCVATLEEANSLLAIMVAQRDKNSSQIGRTWTHPTDPSHTTISSVTGPELLALTEELEAKKVAVTNLQFY
jgi:hypothetical protein